MNYIKQHILSLCLLASVTACTEGTNETVESAYRPPVLPEPSYKFSRNGESSVNTLECKFLKAPIDRIFSRYMSGARMGTKMDYDEAMQMFREGEYGLKPQNEIATSTLHLTDRGKILQDFNSWFDMSTRIAGLGQEKPHEHRSTEAQKGITGYVGINIGDKDICFVDDRGIAVAEVYRYAIMGAIYLDKILNVHLSEDVTENPEVRSAHNLTQLSAGHNYTELEHHWDLAYGYYGFWKPLAQSEGLPALKDSHRRIFQCFVRGRTYMETSRYDEIKLQADTIRHELGRVVAARAMNLLVGANTFANLKENPKHAFRLLSQAYGLIYASQFARNAQGQPFITYQETRKLLQTLEQEGGLWDKERLLGEEKDEGALHYLAAQIGERFGVSPEEIKK